jgi:hypothetical protein
MAVALSAKFRAHAALLKIVIAQRSINFGQSREGDFFKDHALDDESAFTAVVCWVEN